MGCVTQVYSPQSVQIDGIPHHMKDLCPFMGSKPSLGHDSYSEESEQLVNLRSTALGKPDDSPDEGSSEDQMTSQDNSPNTSSQNTEQPNDLLDSSSEDKASIVPLWRNTQCKRPAPKP